MIGQKLKENSKIEKCDIFTNFQTLRKLYIKQKNTEKSIHSWFLPFLQNFPAPPASHIHLDDQGLLNPTNPGQGRRKSHCGGSAANYHYYHQRQTKDLPISHLTTSPTTTTTITTKKHHSLQPQFNQKRRHSSYDVGEELPPPPPPPHKGTNVWKSTYYCSMLI